MTENMTEICLKKYDGKDRAVSHADLKEEQMARIVELPKLPYGQGSYSWADESMEKIRLRKRVNGKYESVTGRSIQECNRLMSELERCKEKEKKRRALDNPSNRTLTLAQSAFKWMDTFKKPILKGKAYDTQEDTYNNWIATAPFANYQYMSVTDSDVQDYLTEILNVKKKSMSTVRKVYSFFNQYFKYVYKAEPYNNPMLNVQLPKNQNNIRLDEDGNIENANEVWGMQSEEYEILDDEEIIRFIYAATVPRIEGKQGYKHGWGLVFMMWTFIRNGEALGLQWKDIDVEKKVATVYKTYSRIKDRDEEKFSGTNYKWALSTVKSAKGVRKFFLSDQAIYALSEYKKIQQPKSDSEFIFSTESGLPINNSNLNLTLSKILVNAGIDKHVTVHGLRHTGISYFIRHNVDKDIVSRMAGHSDVKITNDIYYQILPDQEKSELEKISKMVMGE